MEKEMLAIAKFKSGEGKFEKFMGWMQSDEGMGVRKNIAHVEKTVPAITGLLYKKKKLINKNKYLILT